MESDNKQPNKPQPPQTHSNSFDISGVALFRADSNVAYFYKKTEKLVSAIYMLSSFISDKEPIKWQLRELGTLLLSKSLSVSDRSSFMTNILKILSCLEVSYMGGVISEMNYKVLRFEFESLIQALENSDKSTDAKKMIFSEHFFEVSSPLPVVRSDSHSPVLAKGQTLMSDKKSIKDKGNRQEIILSLLKKNKELGIKDFVASITDCSEKTIQRELALLVTKGQIKKEGEKRWSRYSLK